MSEMLELVNTGQFMSAWYIAEAQTLAPDCADDSLFRTFFEGTFFEGTFFEGDTASVWLVTTNNF